MTRVVRHNRKNQTDENNMLTRISSGLLLATLLSFHPPVTSAGPQIELLVAGYLYPRHVVDSTFADCITEDGRVLGFFFINGVANASYVRFGNGRFSPPLIFPGSNDTLAQGINNNGLICGTFFSSRSGVPHGFFYDGQTYTQYDYPGAAQTNLTGVNDAGDFCGYYDLGFTATATPFVSIGGTVTSFTLDRVDSVFPMDINNLGQIVGSYQDPANSTFHGFFRDTDGTLTYPLDYPDATITTFLSGLNDNGFIVGAWQDNSSPSLHAFVRNPLNQFLSYDYPGALHTTFSDINGSGAIAGYYFDETGQINRSFIARVVNP